MRTLYGYAVSYLKIYKFVLKCVFVYVWNNIAFIGSKLEPKITIVKTLKYYN